MLAYYGDSIAKQGLVGIIIATSPELVTIKPGARGVFGTNPICFAVPREKGNPPFVFDMSTSGVAFFGAMEVCQVLLSYVLKCFVGI
jgi:LDH2 family malate/lactate/ureidoglycolate dehydrogenase